MSCPNKHIIGSAIKYYRKAMSLSQKDLAALMDISPQHVGMWERNKMTPQSRNLLKLSEVLGVSVEDLNAFGKWASMGNIKGASDEAAEEPQDSEVQDRPALRPQDDSSVFENLPSKDSGKRKLTADELRYLIRAEIANDSNVKLLIEYSEKILDNQRRFMGMLDEVLRVITEDEGQ